MARLTEVGFEVGLTPPHINHFTNIAPVATAAAISPTPSGFAPYLHGNICHGPKSWCRGFPQVCCRRLVVDLLSPWLVPLVGTLNKDASK